MIAISQSDKDKWGCPFCGCETALIGNMYSGNTLPVTCIECKQRFVILADGLEKSMIGFGTDKKDENGETIFDYPKLQVHPRKGILKHEYVEVDERPSVDGDYCTSRGVGYDLACFVKTKIAGERITNLINSYDGISCWLDYRKYEPKWIQVKISADKKVREYFLDGKLVENNNVISKKLMDEVMKMPLTFSNIYKYDRGVYYASYYDYRYAKDNLEEIFGDEVFYNEEISENPIDFYERLGLYMLLDDKKCADYKYIVEILSSYLSKSNDEYSTRRKFSKEQVFPRTQYLIDLYNKEFNTTINNYENSEKDWDITSRYNVPDNTLISSLEDEVKKILRGVDYNQLLYVIVSYNNNIEHKKAINEIPTKNIYPLCTLLGLLASLDLNKEYINRRNERVIEMIDHVATTEIIDNPYQDVFNKLKDILSPYKISDVKENDIKKPKQL